MKIIFAAVALSLTLGSCAGGGAGPLGIGAIVGDRNLAAAEPLFSRDEEYCLGSADRLIGAVFGSGNEINAGKRKRSAVACDRIKTNFQYLIPAGALPVPSHYDTSQRNELIDALMAASNRKCTRYAALLKNADGAMNAGLSVGAIITGGLGSILGGVNTAKALAGSSSILSGSRAALNDTYLSNQTIHVLTAAFEKARRGQRRIITNRQACSVEQYTVMRGIEDAFSYHQSCSLVAGLAETALSIERSENPGLDAMRIQLAALANLRRQAAEFASEGPVTPVAGTPAPPSLDKVIASDKALIGFQQAMDAASLAAKAANDEVDKAKAALLAQRAADKAPEAKALADAQANAVKATALVIKLTSARDVAAISRDGEVRALVKVTIPTNIGVEPETRICPFT